MATGKRYYWIKLKESFMTSDTVDYIMSLQDGANYVVLYQMLCLKTINTEGRLSRQIGEVVIPYDAEKIARDFKWFSLDTISNAINLFQSLGLVYKDDAGTIVLANHKNFVGSETDYAEQKRKQRTCTNTSQFTDGQGVDNGVDNVHTEIRDKEIRDKEIRDKEIREEVTTPQARDDVENCVENYVETDKCQELSDVPLLEIQNLYHSICVSFPKIETIDEKTKNAISQIWQKYKDIDIFKKVFTIAERSDFLKGKKTSWKANFEWLMRLSNFDNVLGGKYNDFEKPKERDGSPSFDLDEFYELAAKRGAGIVEGVSLE